MINTGTHILQGLDKLSSKGLYRLLIKGLRDYPSSNNFEIYLETRALFKKNMVYIIRLFQKKLS